MMGCKKKYALSGKVISNSTSQPIANIEVILMQCYDSRDFCTAKVMGSSTTNSNGEFFISWKFKPKGRFYLNIPSALGGNGWHVEGIDINDKNILVKLPP